MLFMNTYEIDEAVARFGFVANPTLSAAACTLANLRDWTDRHSDGWAYWPKPCRAAAQLQRLLYGDGTYDYRHEGVYNVTAADVRKAYRPIKAFLTRYGNVVAPDGDRPSIIEP